MKVVTNDESVTDGNCISSQFNIDDSDPEQWVRWINIGPVPSPKEDEPCRKFPEYQKFNKQRNYAIN